MDNKRTHKISSFAASLFLTLGSLSLSNPAAASNSLSTYQAPDGQQFLQTHMRTVNQNGTKYRAGYDLPITEQGLKGVANFWGTQTLNQRLEGINIKNDNGVFKLYCVYTNFMIHLTLPKGILYELPGHMPRVLGEPFWSVNGKDNMMDLFYGKAFPCIDPIHGVVTKVTGSTNIKEESIKFNQDFDLNLNFL